MRSAYLILAMGMLATLATSHFVCAGGTVNITAQSDRVIAEKLLKQAVMVLRRDLRETSVCMFLVERSLPEAVAMARVQESYVITYFDSFKREGGGRYSVVVETDGEEMISFIIEERKGECLEFYITLLAI